LPDLAPSPPPNLQTRRINGRWHVGFSTRIVNVGEGDFIFRGVRDKGVWRVEQGIPYSTSGAEFVRLDAPLIWGGDGHDHWHVARVAVARLVALDSRGTPEPNQNGRSDTKVGFCFFDHTHQLERGPDEAVYSRHSCGHEDDDVVAMGLSPGWNDTYRSVLPGQVIDVTGLPAGRYRLWMEIDKPGRFRETTRRNNRTWVDFRMYKTPQGLAAPVFAAGPAPR
jgi:hypothetical protein